MSYKTALECGYTNFEYAKEILEEVGDDAAAWYAADAHWESHDGDEDLVEDGASGHLATLRLDWCDTGDQIRAAVMYDKLHKIDNADSDSRQLAIENAHDWAKLCGYGHIVAALEDGALLGSDFDFAHGITVIESEE